MKKNEIRLTGIDALKGFAMICVIVGHTVSNIFVKGIIYSFHMPLFFFLSGCFYRKEEWPEVIRKTAKRCLFPYCTTALAICLYHGIKAFVIDMEPLETTWCWLAAAIYGLPSELIPGRAPDIPAIGAIWFLEALFWCRMELNFLLDRKTIYAQVILLFGLAILSVVVGRTVWLPFNILTGLTACVFFYFGWLFRDWITCTTKVNSRQILEALLVYIPILLLILYRRNYLNLAIHQFPLYGLEILSGIAATFLLIKGFSYIADHQKRITRILSYIGTNTLWIMCVHVFDLDCIRLGWILVPNQLGVARKPVLVIINLTIDIMAAITLRWIVNRIKRAPSP